MSAEEIQPMAKKGGFTPMENAMYITQRTVRRQSHSAIYI